MGPGRQEQAAALRPKVRKVGLEKSCGGRETPQPAKVFVKVISLGDERVIKVLSRLE